jgi:hypothetical protein
MHTSILLSYMCVFVVVLGAVHAESETDVDGDMDLDLRAAVDEFEQQNIMNCE